MSEILKGKLIKKAVNGKGFKIEGNESWLTAQTEEAIALLAQVAEGTFISMEYTKKGVYYNVSKITVENASASTSSVSAKPKCTVCGKELKDSKFKKCFMCNKNNASASTAKTEVKSQEAPVTQQETTKQEVKKTYYDSPEKTAMIQRGNALNAASSAISGNVPGADPQSIKEETLNLANAFLDWLRAE